MKNLRADFVTLVTSASVCWGQLGRLHYSELSPSMEGHENWTSSYGLSARLGSLLQPESRAQGHAWSLLVIPIFHK